MGHVDLHCVVEDHRRYAYVEQHRDQGGETAAAVLERAIEHSPRSATGPEAVMSDNAFAYRKSAAFRDLLAAHGARQILTPPYTPRWNGKVERFIQTLKSEWAYAHSWPTEPSDQADFSLLHRRRPQARPDDRPPIAAFTTSW